MGKIRGTSSPPPNQAYRSETQVSVASPHRTQSSGPQPLRLSGAQPCNPEEPIEKGAGEAEVQGPGLPRSPNSSPEAEGSSWSSGRPHLGSRE